MLKSLSYSCVTLVTNYADYRVNDEKGVNYDSEAKKNDELGVIPLPNTNINPNAMMVEADYAVVALSTMPCGLINGHVIAFITD